MSTDSPAGATAVPVEVRDRVEPEAPEVPADARISQALLRFEIAMRTFSAGLPVDWGCACVQMARALVEADELEPEREGTR